MGCHAQPGQSPLRCHQALPVVLCFVIFVLSTPCTLLLGLVFALPASMIIPPLISPDSLFLSTHKPLCHLPVMDLCFRTFFGPISASLVALPSTPSVSDLHARLFSSPLFSHFLTCKPFISLHVTFVLSAPHVRGNPELSQSYHPVA